MQTSVLRGRGIVSADAPVICHCCQKCCFIKILALQLNVSQSSDVVGSLHAANAGAMQSRMGRNTVNESNYGNRSMVG
jgi:hypothetical protein